VVEDFLIPQDFLLKRRFRATLSFGAMTLSTLTITIDDETLRKAELRAKQEGWSVDKLLSEYLLRYSAMGSETSRLSPEQEALLKNMMERSEKATSRRGNRQWTRDELHERRG
jgi:hypothetical protein